MSALAIIEVDVKKFLKGTETDAEKFGAAFEKLFKKAPAALQVIENFTGEVAPIIVVAIALADPVAEPVVVAALATVQTGLAAVQAAATAANSGQSLLTDIENFATTVPSLLTGLDIKNATLKATVTKIVTLVTGECKVLIPAVQSWVAQIKGTPAAATETA